MRQPLGEVIAQLVAEHDVDVLMLAECEIASGQLMQFLNQDFRKRFVSSFGTNHKIKIFSCYDKELHTEYEDSNLTVRQLALPDREAILLAALHLPSKQYANGTAQLFDCIHAMDAIRKRETAVRHARTVLVGDFNANPFEPGLTSTLGFHAVMSRRIARRGSRQVGGKKYDFFYNPMWGLLGDGSPGPPGSYYHDSTGEEAIYWHLFDQVLVRPCLLDRFDNRDLKILSGWAGGSLLSDNGTPRKARYSDHLPLFFRLSI